MNFIRGENAFLNTPHFFLVLLFCMPLLGVGVVFNSPSLADSDSEAKVFIEGLAEEALVSLTGEGMSKEDRREQFRVLMLKKFAFKVIAKWVLGRHWRTSTEKEKEEYLTLFEDLMVVTYADRFAKYSGEKLIIGKVEIRGKRDSLVHSTLSRSEGAQPVNIAWRVRKTDKIYKVVDVMVEGISMGIAQKKEFSSVIRTNGGKVSGLLDELRKRLASTS